MVKPNNERNKMKNDKYYTDYPTRPIGGGNPYYCCASCGRSDPQINGKLENHNDGCKWVIQKQIQLSAESETETK